MSCVPVKALTGACSGALIRPAIFQAPQGHIQDNHPDIGKGARTFAMPVKKRATNLPQFAELLDLFPCPAWVEDDCGRVLARNARKVTGASCSLRRDQESPGGTKKLRLVALLPDGWEKDCQHGKISAFLAKMHQARQVVAVDKSLLARLTPRQREIYPWFIRGESYKDIGNRIGITPENVKVQVNRMRKILGVEHVPLRRKDAIPHEMTFDKPAEVSREGAKARRITRQQARCRRR